MARVEITFFTTGNRSAEGGTMPVARGTGMITEVVEAGGASSASANAAGGDDRAFVRVLAFGADVWVATGPSAEAVPPSPGSTADGWRVLAGIPADLALEAGDRVAVVEIA